MIYIAASSRYDLDYAEWIRDVVADVQTDPVYDWMTALRVCGDTADAAAEEAARAQLRVCAAADTLIFVEPERDADTVGAWIELGAWLAARGTGAQSRLVEREGALQGLIVIRRRDRDIAGPIAWAARFISRGICIPREELDEGALERALWAAQERKIE